ncbi:2OG-Fe(II) oxygenase [Bizionia myxarmorum]|uniref:2OG-Fe(II) oxygenase n=1 Tax=Bizionia myxarmorum TaxID=291186 RepID=A0A5D0RCK4_9FLAO|nr:2OG-Fe(II) oxygenase [Bizionia myxarmorum]TYB78656.1 2OG-Fe(II) oxygenase [Bizionia myxarmorum]
MNQLFEEISFEENPQYERIIDDILKQKYSLVENFFSEDEVLELRQSLLEKHDADIFKKAAIGNKVNEVIEKTIRGDVILWIDENRADAMEVAFFRKVNNLIEYLNQTCFLGILHKEFHYALYPEGTYYKRHLDTFQNDDRRKLSFVCYLNEAGWLPENGGELVLYFDENGKELEKVIYPFPGRVVIFESQLLEHEVKPVKAERLSITGWLKTR